MADKQQMQAGVDTVIDKCENVIATAQAAIEAVEEALNAAAAAFGTGMEAGSDVVVAENLVALKFVLEEVMGKANTAIDAANESLQRHA